MVDFVLSYEKYKNLIKDADILLFQHEKFPGFGWWIGRYTNSKYSHVALACWNGNDVDCLEFRELRGGRSYPIKQYLEDGYKIDVFRTVTVFEHPVLEYTHHKDFYITYDTHVFNSKVAANIITTAKSLIGIRYDWITIFKFMTTYIPFLRLKDNHKTDDEWHDSHSFVCSTLITYCYRKHFTDPVPFLSDRYTSPGDLARSELFWKLFTLSK
jgi:hypothetical protein